MFCFILIFLLYFFFCLFFPAPSVGLLFFLTFPFFLSLWLKWGRNWRSPLLGVWNSDTFLSPHGQYCLIQGLWFIVLCFSWMWPCYLRRGGFLVGASPTQRAQGITPPWHQLKKNSLIVQFFIHFLQIILDANIKCSLKTHFSFTNKIEKNNSNL